MWHLESKRHKATGSILRLVGRHVWYTMKLLLNIYRPRNVFIRYDSCFFDLSVLRPEDGLLEVDLVWRLVVERKFVGKSF